MLVGIDADGRARGPWRVQDFAPADVVAELLSAFPQLVTALIAGSPILGGPDAGALPAHGRMA